jgi:hypothetical protein
MAASALLAVCGLGLAWQAWSPGGADRMPGAILSWAWAHPGLPAASRGVPRADGRASASPLPPVLLSIEPVGTTADSDAEAPVVFPGYLLPEDSHEESAHEGS